LLNHAQQDPTEELHGEEHFLTPQMKIKHNEQKNHILKL